MKDTKEYLLQWLLAAGFGACLVLAPVAVVRFILYDTAWYLVAAVGLVLAAVGLWILLKRSNRDTVPMEPDEDLKRWFDRHVKLSYLWWFVFFGITALLTFSALTLDANNSKPREVAEFVLSHLRWPLAAAVLLAQSWCMAAWCRKQTITEKKQGFIRDLILIGLLSVFYWGLVLAMFVCFNTTNRKTFYSALAVYTAGALIFTFTIRQRRTFRNLRLSRWAAALLVFAALAGGMYVLLIREVWVLQPYINHISNINKSDAVISYDETAGIYTVTKQRDDFRILQLTDIHLGGSVASSPNDENALRAVYKLIETAKPDLVIVTGDLSYPVGISSFSLNNHTPVELFASFMRNTGVPWAFTYGNHDTEDMAVDNETSLDSLYQSLSWETSRTLLYPYSQPEVTGRNNQLIEIRNRDGSLNQALFLLDSNAYAKDGFSKYDYIHDDQVDWYAAQVERLAAEAGRTVPSLCFFHIPLREYAEAYDLYQQGDPSVTRCFGQNEEDIGCSRYSSKLFDRALELGSTQGFFCGHDHLNNLSLRYKGVQLTYGMSIDYLVYPGISKCSAQRGGTLIVLDEVGQMSVTPLPLEDPEASDD